MTYIVKQRIFDAIKFILRLKVCSPILAKYVLYQIRRDTPHKFLNRNAQSLLLLTPERIPSDDIEALIATQKFSTYFLPKKLINRLIAICWDKRVPLKQTLDPDPSRSDYQHLRRCRQRLRLFYRNLFDKVFSELSIDAVLGATPHYTQNHDLGATSAEMGVPYIILMKECLITNRRHHDRIVNFYSKIDKNSISHIIVHNDCTKDAIVASGLVDNHKISTLGCMRMDRYIEKVDGKVNDAREPITGRKKVVLFSFIHGVGLYGWTNAHPPKGGPGYFELFEKVHQSVGRLAQELSTVDFIIKAKWPDIWLSEIENCLFSAGLNVVEQDNLIITADVPAHDLILSADVVISFGSTTMLESAIAGLPVIVPSFAEAEDPGYQEFIQLLDTYAIYDIAHSQRELEDLVRTRLTEPTIEAAIMSQRIKYFERYVTEVKGGAAERYANKIIDVIQNDKRTLQ